jgi:hypothetical protein
MISEMAHRNHEELFPNQATVASPFTYSSMSPERASSQIPTATAPGSAWPRTR